MTRQGTVLITGLNARHFDAFNLWYESYSRTGLPIRVYDIGLAKSQQAAMRERGIELVPYALGDRYRYGILNLSFAKPFLIRDCVDSTNYEKVIWTDVDTLFVGESVQPMVDRLDSYPLVTVEPFPGDAKANEAIQRRYQNVLDAFPVETERRYWKNVVQCGVIGFNCTRDLDARLLRTWIEIIETAYDLPFDIMPKLFVSADQSCFFLALHRLDALDAIWEDTSWNTTVPNLWGKLFDASTFLPAMKSIFGATSNIIHFNGTINGRKYWNLFEPTLSGGLFCVSDYLHGVEPLGDGTYFRWLPPHTAFQLLALKRIKLSFKTAPHGSRYLDIKVNGTPTRYLFDDNGLLEVEIETAPVTSLEISGDGHVPHLTFDDVLDTRKLLVMLTDVQVVRYGSDTYQQVELQQVDSTCVVAGNVYLNRALISEMQPAQGRYVALLNRLRSLDTAVKI